MSTANDSILVTPGSGATVATHLVNSKEHQVVMLSTESGLIYGSEQVYIYTMTGLTNVAAARTTHFDLFNATGSGVVVELYGVYIIPALVAVTGVGLTWELAWSSSVGSGGTTITATKADQSNASVSGSVTARSKPTSGASIGSVIQYINSSSEETNPYSGMASILNHLDWCGGGAGPLQPITIRENQGIKIDQTTSSSVGTTTLTIVTAMHAPPP